MGLAKKQPVAAIRGLRGTQNGQKRPQNDPFYDISKINEKYLSFFLPNLKITKNIASVKCEKVETVKIFSPEHRISLKAGLPCLELSAEEME